MKYQLIFDLATMSKAPTNVLAWAAAIAAGIMLLVSGLMEYERLWILHKSRTDLKTIEGVVMAHWRNRVKRAGNGNAYWQWEGFSVGDKQFMYRTDAEQNYFSNSQGLKFHDGMPVKVSYLEVTTEGRLMNEITRLEAVVLFP